MATVPWNSLVTFFNSNYQRSVRRATLTLSDDTQKMIMGVGNMKTLLIMPSSAVETGTARLDLYSFSASTLFQSTTYTLTRGYAITLDTNVEAFAITCSGLVATCNVDYISSAPVGE